MLKLFSRFCNCSVRCFFGSDLHTAVPPGNSTSVFVTEDGKKMKLLSGDNEPERRYHSVWLRHNCRCPQCLITSSNQNIVPYENLQDLKLVEADVEGEQVHVKWVSRTGVHSCSFDVDWLKKHDYTSPGIHEERRRREQPLVADTLPQIDYREAAASKEGYYRWMRQINLYGVTLMKNIPVANQHLVKFCEQIGEPQVHPFSRIFEVRSVPNASNVAYTSNDLILHTDQSCLENTPGIQFFYCLRFDDCVEGGESVVVDTYPVIEELRSKYPKHFEVLTRVPYIAWNQHHSLDGQNFPVSFQYSVPHIGVDSHGKVINVSWGLQFHRPLFASEQDTENYYEAFIQLSSMFDNSPRKLIHRLKPGEALITNNRRVLHGRNHFVSNGGVRHLQGFYLSSDYFRSRLVVLANELNKDEPIRHFFNTSHWA